MLIDGLVQLLQRWATHNPVRKTGVVVGIVSRTWWRMN
jgi:hypothetical protein